MSFNPGDQVIINSGLIATIQTYDEDSGIVVYQTKLAGGSTDTTTARIGTVNISKLPTLDDALDEPAVKADKK